MLRNGMRELQLASPDREVVWKSGHFWQILLQKAVEACLE
jgi:hypothetical protein